MEKITIEKDISVFYLTAANFPEDVMETYEELHTLIDKDTERRYFGISQPDRTGRIIYKAAAEELQPGEAEKLGCETFIIKKGEYISMYIEDHFKDPSSIGNAFQQLIARPDIDPKGYCLEWYKNYTDPGVRCMVGLK